MRIKRIVDGAAVVVTAALFDGASHLDQKNSVRHFYVHGIRVSCIRAKVNIQFRIAVRLPLLVARASFKQDESL